MTVVDTNNLKQDWDKTRIFGGEYGGFQRFDKHRYDESRTLEASQVSNFWVPEEIPLLKERQGFPKIDKRHREAFTINLLFQTLADSVQSRGVEKVLAERCTDPSWEPVFATWSYFELIHSKSYSHIIRSMFTNPGKFFDKIEEYPEIKSRFDSELELYNGASNGEDVSIPELLIRVLFLEGVKFYVSFAVTHAINTEYEEALGGVSSIIRLIAHDEQIHTGITSKLLRIGRSDPSELGEDKDADTSTWQTIAHQVARETFKSELGWYEYLFPYIKDIGMLNRRGLEGFIKYRIDKTLTMAGFDPLYEVEKNETVVWFETYNNPNVLHTAQQEKTAIAYNVSTLKKDWTF